jgi:hypothetical protein
VEDVFAVLLACVFAALAEVAAFVPVAFFFGGGD